MARLIAFIIALAVIMGAFVWSASFQSNAPVLKIAGATVKVRVGSGHGSGFHIGEGYILTAAHVLGKDTPTIQTDRGWAYEASILWKNDERDVALLRLADTRPNLRMDRLDCREPRVGEPIRVSGNPAREEFLTFRGHVAGPSDEIGPWKKAAPVDVTMLGGMSGGPVHDQTGAVIGLIVGNWVSRDGWTGLGFYIPSSSICVLLAR